MMEYEATAVFNEMRANVLRVLKPEGFERWMNTSIPALGGLTPTAAFAAGRYDDLLALTRSYLDTSFT